MGRVSLGFLFRASIMYKKVTLCYNDIVQKELQTILSISLSIAIGDIQS